MAGGEQQCCIPDEQVQRITVADIVAVVAFAPGRATMAGSKR